MNTHSKEIFDHINGRILSLFFLMLVSGTLSAQLDTEHYIPPVFGRQVLGTHFIVLGTTEEVTFDVTVRDGAGNVLDVITISDTESNTTQIGFELDSPFLVSEAQLNTPVSEGKGLILTADYPFYANVRVTYPSQASSLTSKGRVALGTDFRTGHMFNNWGQSDQKSNVFSVMATEDNTTVQISEIKEGVIFRNTTPEGTPLTTPEVTVTLDAGESYVVAGFLNEPSATNNVNGFNGTHITSDKNIVVNSGTWLGGNALYGTTPEGYVMNGRDIGLDQIVPRESIGDEYVLQRGQGYDNERTILVAAEDNTEIYFNGDPTPVTTIDAGDFYVFTGEEFSANDNLYLQSSAPIYVYQTTNGHNGIDTPLGQGMDNERQNGLNFIPPVTCSGSQVVNVPNVDFVSEAFINIIARSGAEVEIDGVVQTDPQPIPGTTEYVTYQASGYTGDVLVTSDQVILVALINTDNENSGCAGYFSGFTQEFNVEAVFQGTNLSGSGEVYEGCGDLEISISRGDIDAGTPAVVTIETSGTAQEGVDYSSIPDDLSFEVGETEISFTITVYDDDLIEGVEELILNAFIAGSSCSEDDITFTINDVEPFEVTLSDTAICSGESIDLILEVSGGVEPYVYQWSTSDSTESVTVSSDSTALYTVSAIDFCTDTASASSLVEVASLPDFTLTPDTTICSGNSITLEAESGSSDIDYSWSPVGETGESITVSPLYSLQYTVTGASQTTGCSAQETVFVAVEPSPNATIDSPVDGIICGNATPVEFTSTTPDGIWSGPGILNPTSGTFTPDSAGVGTHTISYTVGSGCVDSALYEIEVLDVPDATITPVDTLCSGDEPITLLAATPDGTWSGQGITDATTGQFDPSASGPGVWTITYTLPGECGDEDTEEIVVLATPDATIDPVDPLCESTQIQILTAADPGGIWSGNGIVDSLGGTFDPALAGEGHHTVTYTFSDYCPSQDSEDVDVLEDADASVEPLATLCISDSIVQLVAAQSGGEWSGNGITDSDTGTFDPSEAGAGIWEITYTINSVCGDQSTVEIEVVDPSSPISTVPPLCEDAGTITLNTTQEGGAWSGTGITNSDEGLFSATSSGVGIHLITYTLELFEGCASTQQTEITVNSLPEVDFSPDQIEGCMPLTVTFENLGANSGSCDWDFGDGTSVIDCSPTVTHTYTNPGVYSPSLTVLDENGCANSISYEDLITVFNLPVASFTHTPDYPSTLDGYLELTDQSVGDITGYEWEGLNGMFSTEQNPVYTFDELGIHYITLYVTDSNGCRDSSVHAVEVEDELHVYIPNAITLNWDGTNDVLIPVISGADRAEFEFQIWDRWGQIMYESTDLENTVWLGGVDKSMVPPGVYTWKLKLRSSATKVIHKMTGHVTVIR